MHLNLPFDKPLEPTPAAAGTAGALPTAGPSDRRAFDVERSPAAAGRPGGAPWLRATGGGGGVTGTSSDPAPDLEPDPVEQLSAALLGARRPLVLAGALQDARGAEAGSALGEALARLHAVLPVPVWAEATSGLRFTAPSRPPAEESDPDGRTGVVPGLVATTELLLAADRFREALAGEHRPDLVLRLGEAPIGWGGRRLAARWAEAGIEQIAVDPWGRRLDPEHGLTRLLVADPAALLDAVAARLAGRIGGRPGALEPGWAALHRAADRAAREALAGAVSSVDELFDGGVFWHLGQVLPEDTALFVSSSMPLRELEIFLPARPPSASGAGSGAGTGPVDVFANRGLNGIDGVTSTALGVALGRRALGRSRTVLVTGDVAFAHDLSGALAAGRLRDHADPVIVLVDNGGGAIFDHLPAAGCEPGFSRHLATPPGADFEALARGCGFDPQGGYQAPASWGAFRRIVETAVSIGGAGPRLVHVRTGRERSKQLRTEIIGRVAAIVDGAVERALGGGTGRRRTDDASIPRGGDRAAQTGRRAAGGRPAGAFAAERDQAAEPPVLFLHGFTGSGADWSALRHFLGQHPARHPALTLDLPGHGAAPVPAAGATVDEAVAAILRELDLHGVGRAHLVGYSLGGRMALATAVRHPDRIAGLALIGATAGIEGTAERRARRESDETLARSIEQGGLHPFIDRWMEQPIFASQLRLGHRALRRARLARLGGSARGYAASLRGMGQGTQPPLWNALPDLQVPTLLIAGALDEKYTALARSMADRLPNARVEIVPDTGHAVHLEAPETVSRLLEDWLG